MSDSIPYLGSKISLISKSEIRYEGILYTIDAQESIIALARVQSFGTEDRHTDKPIPARDDIYEYIIFRGADIKKIEVCESPKQQVSNIHNDPAIVGLQHAAPSVATSYPGVSLNHQPLGPIGSHGTFYGSYGQQIGHQNIPTSGFSLGAPQPSEFSGGIGTTSVGLIGSASVEPHSPIRSSQPLVPTPIGPPPLSSHSHQQQDVLAGSRSSTPSATRKSPVMDAGVQVSPPPQQQQQQQQLIEKKRPSNQPNTQRSPLQQNQNQNQSSNRTLREFQGGQSRRGQGSGFYQQSQNYQYHQGTRYNQGYQGYYQGQGQPQQQQQQQYQGGQYRGGSGGGGMGGRGRASRRNNQSRGRGGFNQGGRQRQDQQQQSFDEEFDFEQANVEFEELRTQLAKTKISDGETSGERKDDKRDDSGHETATTGDESEDSSSSVYYDKTKSFFDSISCEALERSKGRSQRSDWRAERKINVQTFGVATARRGYYPRGRGGYYNRGGYYRNYNQGYYRGSSNNYRGSRGSGQSSGNSNRSIVNGAAGLGGGGGTVGSMNASGSYAAVAAK